MVLAICLISPGRIGCARHIICLLLMVLPLSSWASLAMPCGQGGEPVPIRDTVMETHAHHGGAQLVSPARMQDPQDSASFHHAAQGDNSAPVDCPCCDNCATMCVLSGCSPAAITSVSPEFFLRPDDSGIPLADTFRVSPTPHSLFRPPIPIA